MNFAMELHDSRILEMVHSDDGRGFILFAGVVFRAEGQPGELPQENGWQNVRMRFGDLRLDGAPVPSYNYISDGDLSVDGVKDDGLIPFPACYEGEICLTMCIGEDFETRIFRGSSVIIEAEGEFVLEDIWNIDGTLTQAE